MAKKTTKSAKRPRVIGIIPARIGSEEVHAKVLKILGDKPVIGHVIERVKNAKIFDEIIVAADDEKILEVRKKKKALLITGPFHLLGYSSH